MWVATMMTIPVDVNEGVNLPWTRETSIMNNTIQQIIFFL